MLSFALVSTACGSRLPDDVLESIDAGNTSNTVTQASSGDTTGPQSSSTNGSVPSGQTGAVAAGGQQTTGGSGRTNGGSGNGPSAGGSAQVASKCEDAKSGAPGVTDDEIKVASIVTDSGPLPGATEGSFRGAAAYFAMVNANGGLCGRKVTLLKGDDGLDPAKGRGEFLRLEPQVLGFTGSFSVADSGYINLIESTKVPWVSLVVDPAGRGPRNVMPRTPDNIVNTGPFVWLKREHPDVKRTAVLYAAVGGVGANVPGFEKAIEKAGFERIYTASANVASPDYTAQVQQAQDENIEFLYLFAFEVNMHVRMVRAMRQQNYEPKIKTSNIGFNTRFSELLGTEGDGWRNHQTHLLFLDPKERSRSVELAQFQDWNERLFPGAQLDLFPVSGWGRAALFTDAMRRIEGTITRQALIDALYEVEEFDGGGIEVTIDPRNGLGAACWNMAVHKGGKWIREFPTDKLYDCALGENFKFK